MDQDNIAQFIADHLENSRASGVNFRAGCPICNSVKSLPFIVFETGSYFCHACEEKGNAHHLLNEVLGVEYKAGDYVVPERVAVPEKEDLDFIQEHKLFQKGLSDNLERSMELFYQLLPRKSSSLDYKRLNKFLGYDAYNDTLTVSIFDGDKVINIKRRKVRDIKWMGMKASNGKYSMRKLTGRKMVFVASGMAEFLILEALGNVDYIVAQSDSGEINSVIPKDPLITAIILTDNDMAEIEKEEDEKYRDALHPTKYNRFHGKLTSKISCAKIIIDFCHILNRDIEIGYDLRDFVNEYPEDWAELVDNEIGLWDDWGLIW
ncbi:MAG: hypothetical protein DRG30_07795 [Epsilonproteobacteria bacterium]|nr:MAG: hypothetical protein DRG30_07795 [Campylobacterota bacterium]